jgi:hypothetical protein
MVFAFFSNEVIFILKKMSQDTLWIDDEGKFHHIYGKVLFAYEYIFLFEVLNIELMIGCGGEIVSVRRLQGVMAASGCSLSVDGKNISI